MDRGNFRSTIHGSDDRTNYMNSCSRIKDQDLFVSWKNLSYTIDKTFWERRNPFNEDRHDPPQVILDRISGHLKSGEVVGLMGASGSGKSVLMKCLSGKRMTGLSGIMSSKKGLKVSFIPQDETLMADLTVRELLTFSSKIHGGSDHETAVNATLESLGLLVCANNMSGRCSGGQQKRISVALELLSSPDVLIFDEPTSGLDSAACLGVIDLLSKIARGVNNGIGRKVAVMVSIHQPVNPVFSALDRIYCLAGGRVFYEGSPHSVTNYLKNELGISHEMEDNPADVMMEGSCACFGEEVVKLSLTLQEEMAKMKYLNDGRQSTSMSHEPPNLFKTSFKSITLLISRNMLIGIRDPLILAMRFSATIFSVGLVLLVFEDSGKADPCPKPMTSISVMSSLNQDLDLLNNVSCLQFVMLVSFMAAVAANLFQIPRSYPTIQKEVLNKWYSLNEYVISMAMSDAVFLLFFNILLLFLPFYYFSKQNGHVGILCLLNILFGVTSQAMGHCVVGATVKKPATGIFLLVISIIPLLVISGAFVPVSRLAYSFYWISYFNVFRWGLEATLVIVYGSERCGSQKDLITIINENRKIIYDIVHDIRYTAANAWLFINRSVTLDSNPEAATSVITRLDTIFVKKYISDRGRLASQVMPMYNLEDDDAWKAMVFLLIHMIFWRIFSYIIFHRNIYNK